ncbi:hypothetical protein AK812_SmicGene15880 [Symbiodinium microadriaticum]|uniref:Uncharacterized protein n=1 Tax=Symbiodinium microadriaticum TaxID=2951 RepID=A0A1Q9E1S1_SYMMI|nr:hypothetical protein AK812_SmicGene15880 [Symbiodinium microadriaticum]
MLRAWARGEAELLQAEAVRRVRKSSTNAGIEAAARDVLAALEQLSPLDHCKGKKSWQKLKRTLAEASRILPLLEAAASIDQDLMKRLQSETENVAMWADCLELVRGKTGTSCLTDMEESVFQKVLKLPESVILFLLEETAQRLLKDSAGVMTAGFMNLVCMEGKGLFALARGCLKEVALLQLQSRLLSMWITTISKSPTVEQHLAAVPERFWLPGLARSMGDKPPSQTLRWDDSIENPTGFSPRNFVDLQRFIACAKVAKLKHGEAAELDEMLAAVMLSPSARVYLAFSHAGALRMLWYKVTSFAQDGMKDDQVLGMAKELLPKVASLRAALAALRFPEIATEEYESILAQLPACGRCPQVARVCRGRSMADGESHARDLCVALDAISSLRGQTFPMEVFEKVVNELWAVPATFHCCLSPSDVSRELTPALQMARLRGRVEAEVLGIEQTDKRALVATATLLGDYFSSCSASFAPVACRNGDLLKRSCVLLKNLHDVLGEQMSYMVEESSWKAAVSTAAQRLEHLCWDELLHVVRDMLTRHSYQAVEKHLQTLPLPGTLCDIRRIVQNVGRAKGLFNVAGPSKVGDFEHLLQRMKDVACVQTLNRKAVATILPDVLPEIDRCVKESISFFRKVLHAQEKDIAWADAELDRFRPIHEALQSSNLQRVAWMFEDSKEIDTSVQKLVAFRQSSSEFVKFARGSMAVLSAPSGQNLVVDVWPELVSVNKRMKALREDISATLGCLIVTAMLEKTASPDAGRKVPELLLIMLILCWFLRTIPGYVLIAFRLSVCSAMEPSGVLRAAKALRYLLREEEECIIGAIAALPSKQREMLHTCFSSVADVFGESSASAAQFDSASGSAAISTASASSHMEATPATVNLHALDGLLDDDGKDDDDIIIIDDVGDAAATAVCSPEPVPVSAKKHKAECKTAKPLTFGRQMVQVLASADTVEAGRLVVCK